MTPNVWVVTREDFPMVIELITAYFHELKANEFIQFDIDLSKVETWLNTVNWQTTSIMLRSPDGLLIGTVGPTWWGSTIVAETLVWYVRPSGRERGQGHSLLEAFETEALIRGAVGCMLVDMSGLRPLVFERLSAQYGYPRYGGLYYKKLEGHHG